MPPIPPAPAPPPPPGGAGPAGAVKPPEEKDKPGSALPASGSDEFVKDKDKPGSAGPGSDKNAKKSSKFASALAAVRAIFQKIRQMFANSARNANPIFRISINQTANMLATQAASLIQGILIDSAVKGTNEDTEAQSLNSTAGVLIAETKQNTEQQKEIIAGDKNLKKGLDDLAKMA